MKPPIGVARRLRAFVQTTKQLGRVVMNHLGKTSLPALQPGLKRCL